MSRVHINITADTTPAEIGVMRSVAKSLDTGEAFGELKDQFIMKRTAEVILLLSGYIAYRLDTMTDHLAKSQPYAVRLRNRANTAIRACDEVVKLMEGDVMECNREDYGQESDTLFQCLDSLFEDFHHDEDKPTLQVMRRAKLRYHDPFVAKIKECQHAFEDGYCKGYTDAMDDFMRAAADASEGIDANLLVDIDDEGKVSIKPLKQ